MEPVLYILAFAGISALLVRLARAFFRLIQRSGEAWIAGEAARSRQARGDLTGFDEAAQLEVAARRRRRLASVSVVACLLVLFLPPFTPWTREIYAACSLLWLVRARVRSGGLVVVRRQT
ncbi:MAG TPA: hypothetical protein VF039_07335 [Longimicrobiales bacterium]